MQKKNKAVFVILALLALLALLYGGIARFFNTHFFPYTFVDGIDIGFMTDEDAREKLASANEINKIIIFNSNDTIEKLDLSGIEHRRVYADMDAVIGQQDAVKWPLYIFSRKNIASEYSYILDEERLGALVAELKLLEAENQVQPQDAYVYKNEADSSYVIADEVYGSDVDESRLMDRVKECIFNGTEDIVLAEADLYIQPELKANDEYIINKAGLLNRLNALKVELDLEADTVHRLETDYLYSFYADPAAGDYTVNEEKAAELADGIAERYNTAPVDGVRLFQSASGRIVRIKSDYGWKLDREKTLEAIRQGFAELAAFLQSESAEDRAFLVKAEWEKKAVSHKPRDIGNTYAEVDITNQTVYMVKDKALVFSSPCVTGWPVAGRATPDGIYAITYKQPGKVLTGRRPDGSILYQSPVSYWMPFNKGIGFHDATWRGKFGGEIYKRNGSHGCINMPFAKAKELYQLVYPGMPVVCYF